jgi:hypothetical protein
MWYNIFRSNSDLFKEAAASAAASYLECGSLLPPFRPFRRRHARHLLAPALRKNTELRFPSYVNS